MVTARLTADFRKWTIELFAERCREAFADVSVLPNATVLKHGLALSEYFGGAVDLYPAWDSATGLGTIWAIWRDRRNYQLVWIAADDGESEEFINQAEAEAFLAEIEAAGEWSVRPEGEP